jgi:RNA polymerase sigma-70 factor, ECF subfamily
MLVPRAAAAVYVGRMTDTMKTALPSFEAAALPHLPDLLRFATSLARDPAAAEDLVQDVYLAALRSWHLYDPSLDCRNWLFTICRHRFYRISARARRVVPVEDAELESLSAAALTMSETPANFATTLEREDLRDAIRRAMVTLPEPFRDVALLVDWHDCSYDAAAAILEVPVGTVRSRLFRARRILQKNLIEHARDAGLTVGPAPIPRTEIAGT